jgi:hypothetical protein
MTKDEYEQRSLRLMRGALAAFHDGNDKRLRACRAASEQLDARWGREVHSEAAAREAYNDPRAAAERHARANRLVLDDAATAEKGWPVWIDPGG